MNALEKRLTQLNPGLLNNLHQTVTEVDQLLSKYNVNFPEYTDHSIKHTSRVFLLASELLTPEEIDNLNDDEIYILSMACHLHDIGMCIPPEKIKEIENTKDFINYRESHPELTIQEYLRDIHHELSEKFINSEWENLKIPSQSYANAIALVAKGHRKVDLDDVDIYKPKYFVKDGRDFVCLPYIASILRIADELDITNIRTPYLLTKYYMPNNEISIAEWKKHIATTQINFDNDQVIFKVKCSDQSTFAALQDQFEKIQKTINLCQRIIRRIANTDKRKFSLVLSKVIPEYEFIGFDPKGIKFSFDVPNVIQAFIGEDLYENELTSIREALQNAIDTCNYKKTLLKFGYEPNISIITAREFIRVDDNGLGMDDFIIENFFGRLASSFYEQEKVKKEYEAIGQFGVGVFSYFLLADYIDIETKSESKPPIKFRIDKDPKNYFHFFDDAERAESGTSITLYLKKKYVGKLDYSIIEEYVKTLFRYIEIPIKIYNETNLATTIEKSDLTLIDEEELNSRVAVVYKKHSGNLQLIKAKIENDEFEGECGIIVNKLNSNKGLDDSFEKYLDNAVFRISQPGLSDIAVSQKGVLVTYFSGCLLENIIGNINLKRKKKINIKRDEFLETEEDSIYKIINQFENKIIDDLFLIAEKDNDNNYLLKFTCQFLEHYYEGYDWRAVSGECTEIFNKHLKANIFNNGVNSIIAIDDLPEEFIFIHGGENAADVYNLFSIPVVSLPGNYYMTFYRLKNIFTKLFKWTYSLAVADGKAYYKMSKNKLNIHSNKEAIIKRIMPNYYREMVPIESDFIIATVWHNKNLKEYGKDFYYSDLILNINHPFIDYILKHWNEISLNQLYLKIVTAALNLILTRFPINKNAHAISELNEILSSLSSLEKPPVFTTRDFPAINKKKTSTSPLEEFTV